ncbi:unnamed protein product [Echinostoma caproni]|uniref:Reverse transcriptase n=1 Tax=Echinostoma caproni TaxID=27848 RepID=A0A183AUC8_9TREM|nr:unnamed protein product [Echinostoma caproni]
MEQHSVISKVESSAWATPIVVVMKSDDRTPRICGDYRLTLNPRLRRCAATTMEPEDFMKSLHECQDRIGGRIPMDSTRCRISLSNKNQHVVGNVPV